MTKPKPTYDVINTNEIRDLVGDRQRTHFEDCWKYHPACMVHKLCDEIDNLRTARTALSIHRDLLLTKVNELEMKLKELQS